MKRVISAAALIFIAFPSFGDAWTCSGWKSTSIVDEDGRFVDAYVNLDDHRVSIDQSGIREEETGIYFAMTKCRLAEGRPIFCRHSDGDFFGMFRLGFDDQFFLDYIQKAESANYYGVQVKGRCKKL